MLDNTTNDNTDDDEISLIDLFAVLLHYKKMIIGITVFAAVAAVTFALISRALPVDISPLPNKYTPEAIMLINNSSSQAGGLGSMLSSSGLGGLASLAGVNVPGASSYSDLATYLATSNMVLDAVAKKFDIVHRYKIKKFPVSAARKLLKGKIKAKYDEKSRVFTIDCTDTDPAFARDIVNFVVDDIEGLFTSLGLDKDKLEKENLEKNIASAYAEIGKLNKEAFELGRNGAGPGQSFTLESNRIQMEEQVQKELYTQLRVQYESLKVKMASESPVFQVLQKAAIPDMKSGPSRGLLCIIITFAAFFLAVFLAFTLSAIGNIKKDPEAMAKLRGKV
jgi:uncharacterized protein involved in exopolysaccharide biosynthesis